MMSRFSIGQLLYEDRLTPVTLSIDSNTEKYNKLLLRAHDLLGCLQVSEDTVKVDENAVSNNVSNDRAAPVTRSTDRPRRFKALKTSLETRQLFMKQTPLQKRYILTYGTKTSNRRTEILPDYSKILMQTREALLHGTTTPLRGL